MKASVWPDWLQDIWAKSVAKGVGGQPETLADHTWYVLERLDDLIDLRPTLPEALGVQRLWHRLYWAAYLHDWGKAAAGFQARLRGGEPWPYRHEVISLAFLDWFAPYQDTNDLLWIASAIVSHHRDMEDICARYAPPEEGDEDEFATQLSQISDKTLEGLWRWVSECSQSWLTELKMDTRGVSLLRPIPLDDAINVFRKQGAQSVYRWLRKYERFVGKLHAKDSITIAATALRGHMIMADHMASAHVDRPPAFTLYADDVLVSRKLSWEQAHDHQKRAHAASGHALLVAPTGSGKTEAALLWAAAQQPDTGTIPRLFYTLPFQASMNAMVLRLQEIFGRDHYVGLQHGRALLALYRLGMEQEEYTPEQAAQQARRARNLMSLNYYPVRVFSPYQMLKAFYRLRGYEALLSDLQRGLFIFDEIHAYEAPRLAMIMKSVEYLSRNYGARFLFMSATFPSLIRQVLTKTLGNPIEIHASPDLFANFRRHRLHLLDGEILDTEVLDRIERSARQGLSVLVCCTTVARAQRMHTELIERLADSQAHVELLHSGFNMRDRSRKERLVREWAGRDETRRRPFVLVATQVVEVSLDIDLDVLYSEPAPLEALVQRFGRINRRRLQKELAPVYVMRKPDDGQHVYKPAQLISRTLELLERENGNPIDESAIGCWLDEIYEGELAKEWQRDYIAAEREFEVACLGGLVPFQSSHHLEELFSRAFDGIDVLPKCLEDEYEQIKEENPILAQELVCTISYGRLCQLRRAELTWEDTDSHHGPIPIEVPYDDKIGLDLSILRQQDDDDGDDF